LCVCVRAIVGPSHQVCYLVADAKLLCSLSQMFQTLYGQTAAALYAKAAGQNAQARQLYNASADTYYKANDAAAYDDWVRARNHWDYFYNRS
jgi:hypothetical protein